MARKHSTVVRRPSLSAEGLVGHDMAALGEDDVEAEEQPESVVPRLRPSNNAEELLGHLLAAEKQD